MSIEADIKFKLAEQLMLEAVCKDAEKESAIQLAKDISNFVKSTNSALPNIVAAVYMLHSLHVEAAVNAMDGQSEAQAAPQQIPPWMQ